MAETTTTETTTTETTTRTPWTVSAEEAGALSNPAASTPDTTGNASVDPLLQAQQHLREYAIAKRAEGYALTQVAQDIDSAIANRQFKLSERDAIKQQTEIAQTRNYFQVKAAKSALEADVLSAATNSFDAAGKAYLTSSEISGTQEKQAFDAKEEIRRDANMMLIS